METLDCFELRNQKFFLSPVDAGPASVDTPERLVTVGELLINNQKYLILQETTAKGEPAAKEASDVLGSLTRRELQIIVMVSDGLVNKVIADKLNISEWTVSTHLRRIFAKLRVDSRSEMVYRCAKLIESQKK
jgi:DNA-binding NarL/FixJ family response regulator